jgi:hypothetical protein
MKSLLSTSRTGAGEGREGPFLRDARLHDLLATLQRSRLLCFFILAYSFLS